MMPFSDTLFKKNIALFTSRFPSIDLSGCSGEDGKGGEAVYEWITARNGSITAKDMSSSGGVLLHSIYNPEREAKRLIEKDNHHSAIFCGFGLGYEAVEWARKIENEESKGERAGALILIERDKKRFYLALHAVDWESVFHVRRLVIALGCPVEQIIPLITSIADIRDCAVFAVPSHIMHDASYFESVIALISRNRRKEEINFATTKRFCKRWMANICLNTASIVKNMLPRVGIAYERLFVNPCHIVTLLAAGPSLEDVLPYLKEIKKHSLIVAVDTALKAILREGIEPDYIVLSDPQYYAWRHIGGLSSPSSVLITDLSAYPAVLRFNCHKVLLTHSAIPMAKYFEKKLFYTLSKDKIADLGAGGSVASSAWNLSYLLGASCIYLAGLDLSFPLGKSHVKGSTLEEEAISTCTRLCTAENASVPRLIGGVKESGKDYNGDCVATDRRMKMFAWWFESRLAEVAAKGSNVKTYTLSPSSLMIPGVEVADVKEILSCPVRHTIEDKDNSTVNSALLNGDVFISFKQDIEELSSLIDKVLHTADTKTIINAAKEMRVNSLMESILFETVKIDWDNPAKEAIKSATEKGEKYLKLLSSTAEHFHLF